MQRIYSWTGKCLALCRRDNREKEVLSGPARPRAGFCWSVRFTAPEKCLESVIRLPRALVFALGVSLFAVLDESRAEMRAIFWPSTLSVMAMGCSLAALFERPCDVQPLDRTFDHADRVSLDCGHRSRTKSATSRSSQTQKNILPQKRHSLDPHASRFLSR